MKKEMCSKCGGSGVIRTDYVRYIEGFGNTNMDICPSCHGKPSKDWHYSKTRCNKKECGDCSSSAFLRE